MKTTIGLFSSVFILLLCGSVQGRALDPVKVEECMASPARGVELREVDLRNVQAVFARFHEVPTPALFTRTMERLVSASNRLDGRVVRVRAFNSRVFNAHEVDHGDILVSIAALTVLTEEEIAAALAHELAHLEARDALRSACESLALGTNYEIPLGVAIADISTEAFGAGFGHVNELSKILQKQSRSRELLADVRGAELLQRAGFDPSAMVGLLRKLVPADSMFSNGTHPSIEHRVTNVLDAIARFKSNTALATVR